MRIEIGNYVLCSDRFCMWISEMREVKSGKDKGKMKTDRVTGYFTSVQAMLEDFRRKKVLGADVDTIEDLTAVIDAVIRDSEMLEEEIERINSWEKK